MYFVTYSVLYIIKLRVKEVDTIMGDKVKNTKENKLKFNTYCIFTEEKKDVKETIGLIFKDYLENIKIKTK